MIPYKVQKGNRPKIEEVISYCLDGDLQRSALDFTAWLRENGMPVKLHTSTTRSQRAEYKGVPICYIIIYGEEDWKSLGGHHRGDPVYWSVSPVLFNMNKYEEMIKNENLHINFNGIIYWCTHGINGDGKGRCDPNKACAGGRDFTIFGSGVKGVCTGLWPAIKNPDETTIKNIKRLLELEQNARGVK